MNIKHLIVAVLGAIIFPVLADQPKTGSFWNTEDIFKDSLPEQHKSLTTAQRALCLFKALSTGGLGYLAAEATLACLYAPYKEGASIKVYSVFFSLACVSALFGLDMAKFSAENFRSAFKEEDPEL